MSNRTVSIPLILFVWVIIGVVVAINKDYGRNLNDASHIATFILAVVLWPIPATDGSVFIHF
jgi:hypothetical protein